MIPSRIKSPAGLLDAADIAKESLASFSGPHIIGENNILRVVCFGFGTKALLVMLALYSGVLPISGAEVPGEAVKSVVRADSRSGKLVRVVVAPQTTSGAPNPALASTVERIATEQALPPELIHSVIQTESNYNPFAISPKGALGIMQLVPETARRFGVSNAFNAEENIQGGAKYLKYLLNLYHGDYPLALAAYNAGEGAVARHGGVPPYPETRNYVNTVLSRKSAYASTKAAAQKPAVQSKAAGTKVEDGVAPEYNPIRQIVEPDGSVRYVSR
jgi:hypothetical protein